MRTPLRWCGSLLVLIGVALALTTRQPDILVAGDGQSVAVRGADGALRIMQTRKDAFAVRSWLTADADARNADDPTLTSGVRCDAAGCATQSADGRYVTIVQRGDAFADDCRKAAVIVTARQPPAACAARMFTHERLRETGSLALYRHGAGFVADAVKPPGSNRPWARNAYVGGEGGDVSAASASPSRPVDATPTPESLSPDDQ